MKRQGGGLGRARGPVWALETRKSPGSLTYGEAGRRRFNGNAFIDVLVYIHIRTSTQFQRRMALPFLCARIQPSFGILRRSALSDIHSEEIETFT